MKPDSRPATTEPSSDGTPGSRRRLGARSAAPGGAGSLAAHGGSRSAAPGGAGSPAAHGGARSAAPGGAGSLARSSAATVALTVLTMVTGAGLGRLFEGRTYLAPVLLAALACHVGAWALRRRAVPTLLAVPAGLALAGLVAIWAVLPQTTAYGLPGPATWHALSQVLAQARLDFRDMSAPVPATPGFLLVAMLVVGGAAVLADWAAFRVGTALEAALPTFAIFVFTAGLGTPGGRPLAVAGWLAALLGFLLVVEVEGRTAATTWFSGGGTTRRRPVLFGAGAGLAVVAIVLASLVGPALPGARTAALVNWHNQDSRGPAQRTTISPLVNIKAELLQPSDVEVFTVASPAPTYWRLTSLDHFTGTIWSSDDSYQPAGGPLPVVGPDPGGRNVDQRFAITSLDSVWLPAAYRPVQLSGIKAASYNANSASVITSGSTYPGLSYQVRSALPALDSTELSRERVDPGDPALARYLQLPPTVAPQVKVLAGQIVARQTTDYGRALALQDFFRRHFTYSLDIPPGASNDSVDALTAFLFRTRTGYCQQFAGAYAVMARAVGLPTRVAVGFTPGDLESDGLYHVRALNAHAWPEVYLGQYGWVPFEPTPGRGEPGAQSYTGVAPQQAEATGAPAPAPVTTATHSSPATTAAPSASRLATQRKTGELSGPTGPSSARTGAPAVVVAVVVVVVGLLALATTPLLLALRRRRRRARAGDDRERILVAFAEVAEALAGAGCPRHPAETFVTYARRVAPMLAAPTALGLVELAQDAQEAVYAPEAAVGALGASGAGADEGGAWVGGAGAAGGAGRTAARRATEVVQAVHHQGALAQRLGRRLDPRQLLDADGSRRWRPASPGGLVDEPASNLPAAASVSTVSPGAS